MGYHGKSPTSLNTKKQHKPSKPDSVTQKFTRCQDFILSTSTRLMTNQILDDMKDNVVWWQPATQMVQ